MLINADFSLRATVTPTDYRWVASPQPGVERVMLDRVGEEIARATSLVRYARNSSFPPHQHPGGEEILVIEGVFSDEQGDYPAGWYLRNPPGSSHSPRSRQGAVILVKLCQMHSEDSQSVRIDSGDPLNWNFVGGRVTCTLFSGNNEHVSM
ncbi:cupin domain-containing protein [Comamonas sediminis]